MTQRGLTGRLGVYRVRLRQPERRSGDSRPFAHKKSKDQREIGVHEPGRRFLTDPVAAIETEIVPKAPRVRPNGFSRETKRPSEIERGPNKTVMATVHTSIIKLLALAFEDGDDIKRQLDNWKKLSITYPIFLSDTTETTLLVSSRRTSGKSSARFRRAYDVPSR